MTMGRDEREALERALDQFGFAGMGADAIRAAYTNRDGDPDAVVRQWFGRFVEEGIAIARSQILALRSELLEEREARLRAESRDASKDRTIARLRERLRRQDPRVE